MRPPGMVTLRNLADVGKGSENYGVSAAIANAAELGGRDCPHHSREFVGVRRLSADVAVTCPFLPGEELRGLGLRHATGRAAVVAHVERTDDV